MCDRFIEVGEEELTQWRKDHRESVRRERGREGGKGAESHEEVAIDQCFFITFEETSCNSKNDCMRVFMLEYLSQS